MAALKRWLKAFGIAGLIVGIFVVLVVIYWTLTPGNHESRYSRIEVGMPERQVLEIMGSEGESAQKGYRIAGDNRARVWVIKEKGQRLEIVVVFDDDSRVIAKDMYKSSVIMNEILKDL
jgi:hypothetical protein